MRLCGEPVSARITTYTELQPSSASPERLQQAVKIVMPEANYFVHTLLRARDWQHRPEFDRVCEWWRGGGRGVCALVGMGGTGKTAIADRFLNELLDDPNLNRQRGNRPRSVFVYSFYNDDKPENFFRYLQVWLEGTSAPDKQKSPTQLMFDVQQHKGLIILDGLERVQKSSVRGGLGQLTSPDLRHLLNHIACGSAREVSVLATSRFPLTDLRDSQPRYFHTIAIDQIAVASGVALLRGRGVRGTDVQLAAIVEHCGRHALTVDLAGGYIKEYGHGDQATPLDLGTTEELEAQAGQEPDDDKRAVLKQGIRLARISQRYREAMLDSDEAALAILERICLFRLGVDCETLAAIFTGPAAEKVSGKALASLGGNQVQERLDWLERMRIVEANRHRISDEKTQLRYTVHPAVRDGVLSGISRNDVRIGHEAIRHELKISLGSTPGKDLSTNPDTLDLLEELVHHTLQVGKLSAAIGVYRDKMGGFNNLRWKLGEFSRGERICSEIVASAQQGRRGIIGLRTDKEELILELGVYKQQLGLIDEAAKCFEQYIALCQGDNPCRDYEESTKASICLAESHALRGRLLSVRREASRAVEFVDIADDGEWPIHPYDIWRSHAFALLGSVAAMTGYTNEALSTFKRASESHRKGSPQEEEGLLAFRGVLHAGFLAYLGRFQHAQALTEGNRQTMIAVSDEQDESVTRCNLLLAHLSHVRGDLRLARTLVNDTLKWACDRGHQDLLCASTLAVAIIESATERPVVVETAITDGLKIARDCGYGLHHIDLLLERARLHLLRGNAGAALDDIEVALDTGVPASEETGQVELLAANHVECGYAWAIPTGLQLRAEAQLLRAAQIVGSPRSEPCAHNSPAETRELIKQAESNLRNAMTRWKTLRDPEPTEDNNFVHPRSGEQYNYRAAKTYQVLVQLEGGMLTRYPLEVVAADDESEQTPVEARPNETAVKPAPTFDTFLSHNSKDKPEVKRLGEALKKRGLTVWLDEWELRPGLSWQNGLEEIITNCKSAAVCVGGNGIGPWEDPEMKALLRRFVNEKMAGNIVPIIPVLLPGAPNNVKLPPFLEAFTWVDLRDGLKKDGLDRLEWGITGVNPNT